MVDERAHLIQANRHIREGRDRIADLEDRIAARQRRDVPVDLAEKNLATMRQTLELMVGHRKLIRAAIRRENVENANRNTTAYRRSTPVEELPNSSEFRVDDR